MGANTSSEQDNSDKDRVLKKAGSQFSPEEGQAIKKIFVAIAGTDSRSVYEESHLQKYFEGEKFHLSVECVTRLFSALIGEDKDKYRQLSGNQAPQQSFHYFVQHTSHFLKGSLSEKAKRLYIFCSGTAAPLTQDLLQIRLMELIQAFSESQCVTSVCPHLSLFPHRNKSSQRLSAYLTSSLSESTLSQTDFEVWMSKSELGQKIFDVVFGFCFYSEVLCPGGSGEEATSSSNAAIPADILNTLGVGSRTEDGKQITDRVLVPVKVSHPILCETFKSQLLDLSSSMLLNSYLPTEVRGTLYPLFSSAHHGESFSMFCKQLVAAKGPTLVVVEDTEGYVFGGFAAEKWQCGPKFKGSASCFLFSLVPVMGVYLPSGYNDNYMYLEQNAQTLPNGLGMGGQLEYFGLWLSADYGTGHSKARPKCSTYNSPQLSHKEEFKVQHLEVWGVGDPVQPDRDEEDGSSQPSILDKDKIASHLLEMAGKKLYSKDVREAPDES